MTINHVFLTGPPGVGKTTLVKKVVQVLQDIHAVTASGFYTEELRDHRTRVGFDVVGFDGMRCALARTDFNANAVDRKQPKVGKYFVSLNEFERNAISSIAKSSGFVVIDEIGKMELFSSRFKQEVTKLLNNSNVTILGTIPIYRNIAFVENIRHRSDVSVVEITVQNRNDESVVKSITSTILSSLSQS